MKVTLKLLNSSQQVVATAQFEILQTRKGPSNPGLSAMAVYHWIGGQFDDTQPKGRAVVTVVQGDDELSLTCDVSTALAAFGCGSCVIREIDDIDRLFQDEEVSQEARQLV